MIDQTSPRGWWRMENPDQITDGDLILGGWGPGQTDLAGLVINLGCKGKHGRWTASMEVGSEAADCS